MGSIPQRLGGVRQIPEVPDREGMDHQATQTFRGPTANDLSGKGFLAFWRTRKPESLRGMTTVGRGCLKLEVKGATNGGCRGCYT